jgi:hypothetical protein
VEVQTCKKRHKGIRMLVSMRLLPDEYGESEHRDIGMELV